MKKFLSLQTCLMILVILTGYGQVDSTDSPLIVNDTLQQDFGLFASDDILNLTLSFDITKYKKKKPKEEYMEAVLTYYINENDSISKTIKLRSRGIMRNGYCEFPPIRLNLKNSGLKDTEFGETSKLKMVTHCISGREEYLFKEYLVYKLFNVLTDQSFKVRLARVNYINTTKDNKSYKSYAFFIEPIEMLAKRINAVEVKTTNLTQRSIFPEIMDKMAIFNYMIGNTDWSVPIQHNCVFLSSLNIRMAGLAIIVPYDFDYSGLVDTDYAVPFKDLGLESVRERRYLGQCRSKDVFMNALMEFTDKKDEFYKVINEFPMLDSKAKKSMINYLDSFYEKMDKSSSILYDLMNGCINL